MINDKINWYKYIIALRNEKILSYKLFIKALKIIDNDFIPLLKLGSKYSVINVKKWKKI